MKRSTFYASLAMICLLVVTGQAQQRRMQLEDLGRVVRVSDPQIAPDGKSIVVVVARANYDENRYDSDLILVDIASGNHRTLTSERRSVSQPRFSPAGDRLAFLSSVQLAGGLQPRPQILVMPMGGGDVRRLTSAPKGVQQFAWCPDGNSIAYATDEDEAEKKSGPERFNDSFEVENDDFLIPLMAANGWVVFQLNYRGSDQIGKVYQRAIINDAGAGPGRDVMAGIEALKQRGFVDTTRIAVSGWSYGGYMTTSLLGNYQGWRVAVAGAAVTDWLDQYNLGDANVRRGPAFGGSPWTDPKRMQAYIEQSPITYASKIRTPTLVMTNTQDFRVTPTQSFKLYHALRDNGVPTKFIAYPIYGHNVRQRDVQRRWIEWIEQYFREPPSSGK